MYWIWGCEQAKPLASWSKACFASWSKVWFKFNLIELEFELLVLLVRCNELSLSVSSNYSNIGEV